MTLRPRTLFARTALTIAVTLIVFMTVVIGAAIYFVYLPLAKRNADDFAAEVISAAHSLQELPESMHDDLKHELLVDHGLIVAEQEGDAPEGEASIAYLPYFKESLAQQAGEPLSIYDTGSGPLIWVDVPAHDRMYRLGFDRHRVGINPPVALMVIFVGGAALTLLASLTEVRRVVRPLDRLSAAVKRLGSGLSPGHLPEDGPAEIASLARALNQLSSDLKQMADNRTVMISGISHDLRTPLTRMALAIEMLEESADARLVDRLRRDLEAMDNLIGQFLQFSRGIEDERPSQLNLRHVLEAIASDFEEYGPEIRLHRNDPPCVYYADAVALERVLVNLLRNAVQYGSGEPVDIELHCSRDEVSIEISDRGPGIPETERDAVFYPFHRLEYARSTVTGGSGLGLAIARQLSLKHGWTIELLPREGGGTVARLGLPTANRLGLSVSSCAA